MRLVLPLATALTLTLISAVSFARGAEIAAGDIVVTQAWARATPPGAKVGAAYLTIENRGAEEDRLEAASSEAAGSVDVHETFEANGIARMRPVLELSIPAGGSVEMRPGGMHVMLLDLAGPIVAGHEISLTLDFAKAGRLSVPVQVAPIGAAGPDKHDHAM